MSLPFSLYVNKFDVTPDLLGATIKNTLGQIDALNFQLRDPKGKYIFGESAIRNGQLVDVYIAGRLIYHGYVDDWDDNVDAETVNQGVFSLGIGEQLNWIKLYNTYTQWRAEEIAKDIAEQAKLKYLMGLIEQTAKTNVVYYQTGGQKAIKEVLAPENVIPDVTPAGDVRPIPTDKKKKLVGTPALIEGKNIGNIKISRKMIGWYCDYYTQYGGTASQPLPDDGWTESIDLWIKIGTNTSLGTSTDRVKGAVSIRCGILDKDLTRQFRYPSSYDLNYPVSFFNLLHFWFKFNNATLITGTPKVRLCESVSKYAEKAFSITASWTEQNLDLSTFTLVGGFSLSTSTINFVEFEFTSSLSVSPPSVLPYLYVDDVKITGGEIGVTAENLPSRKMYGGPDEVPHKDFDTDPNLHDPGRVKLLAETYVNDLNHGQPKIVIQLDYYDIPDFRAGDWVWLSIPSRAINDYCQVQEMTHTCQGGGKGYVCHLTISGLPIQTARYFADIKDRLKEVEYRTA